MLIINRMLWTGAIVGAAVAGAASISPIDAAEFYEGKTVTVLVPNSPGGGLDLIIRSFTRHWRKHIPGQPKMVVKNMPGGGGTRSLNYLYNKAKPDGLTVNWGSWNAAGVVAKRPGLRFKPEEFGFVGAGGIPFLTLVRTDLKPKIARESDIVKAAKFNVGGRSPDRSLDLLGNMALQMIGADYRFVGGYRGMAKIKPALLAGEVHAANMGYIGYHLFFKNGIVKEGKGIALWYNSSFDAKGNPVGNAQISGVRPFHEVYRDVHGKLPSGPLWQAYKWYNTTVAAMAQSAFVPPGTPRQAVLALRKGYYATANDPAYFEPERKRIGIGLSFIDPDRGEKILKTFRNVSPKVFAELERISNIGIRGGKKKRR